MNSPQKSSLLLAASILLMTLACFLPAVHISPGDSPVLGWGAAYYSAVGLRFLPKQIGFICALGFVANILFIAGFSVFVLCLRIRTSRPRYRHLALLPAAGCLSCIAASIWLMPGSLHIGAALWLWAQVILTYAVWNHPEPQRSRGFEVLPLKRATTAT